MKITLNGLSQPLDCPVTVSELLAQRKMDPNAVVVEINGEIITTEKYGNTRLSDRDQVEILRFVGGG